MTKTIVLQKTWLCPDGIGKNDPVLGIPPGTCRTQGPEGAFCPLHQVPLVRATLLLDLATKTVMGEEDIDPEIDRLDLGRVAQGKAKHSPQERAAHRVKRLQDIAEAIVAARKTEHKP